MFEVCIVRSEMSEPFTPSSEAWRSGHSKPGQPPVYKTPDVTPHGVSAPSSQNKSKNPAIAELQVELDATKEIMIDNIDRIAERGQHLDALHDRTETLHYQSQLFNNTAKKTRNKMFWSNKKWTIALILLGVLILAGIIGGIVKSTKGQ